MTLKNKLGITNSFVLTREGKKYDFVGEIRNVNISNGNFHFAPVI